MRTLLVISAASVALLAVACGEQGTTTPTAAVVVKRPVADAGVATVSSAEPYQYTYVAMGKRDPFRASTIAQEPGPENSGRDKNGIDACDEPLCLVDLDELKLVAVVSGDANPVAMVEDRSGVGHVIRRNTKVGKQAGKVTAILRDCIVVTSFVVGPDGRSQPNRQNLCVSTEGQAPSQILDLMNGKTRE